MITRKEAVKVLGQLADSDIISDDLRESLNQISECIAVGDRKESIGLDIWGAKDNDYLDLYVFRAMWSLQRDKISDTAEKHLEEKRLEEKHLEDTYERYRIKENKVTFYEWLKEWGGRRNND